MSILNLKGSYEQTIHMWALDCLGASSATDLLSLGSVFLWLRL